MRQDSHSSLAGVDTPPSSGAQGIAVPAVDPAGILGGPAGGDGRGSVDARVLEQWLLDVGSGDRRRFRQVFNVLAPRAKAYLLRRGLSARAADPIVVQTFVAVWRNAGQFDPRLCSAPAWFFQVLRAAAGKALQTQDGLAS